MVSGTRNGSGGRLRRWWPGLLLACALPAGLIASRLPMPGAAPRTATTSEAGSGRAAVAPASLPGNGGTATAAGNPPARALSAQGLPETDARLLEQIETARLGLVAAQAASARSGGAQSASDRSIRPASKRTPPATTPAAPSGPVPQSAGWIAGACVLGAALWRMRRARFRGPFALPRLRKHAFAASVPSMPPAHVPSPAPGVPPRTPEPVLESRIRALEGSILDLLRMVETVAARIEEPVEDGARAVPTPPRGPALDPDLVLPASGTTVERPALPASGRTADLPAQAAEIPDAPAADGRSLGRIRTAVLRLAAEGWARERIAAALRVPPGDVALVLKTNGRQAGAGAEFVSAVR